MGNTKTLLPSRGGGSPLLHRAGHSQMVLLGQTGGGPRPGMGHPHTLLCPSSALFSSWGWPESHCGWVCGMLPAAPGLVPCPSLGGFLPTVIPPSQLWECWWEQGAWGMMEKHDGSRGHGRDTAILGGSNRCRWGESWGRAGLTAPKLGSQHPG